MSVLETPRIYFSGQVAWDPIVTNNYAQFYDENSAETVYPTEVDKVAAFRAAAIKAVTPRNWNPHGTHRSTFFESAISGADLGAGLVQNDKFVGSPANFMGMLVDLEPYGTISSQLFFDAMSFGIAGGYRIVAPRKWRITSRYINFFRCPKGAKAGVASVIWQTSFPKEHGLRIDAFDSLALQALQNALADDDVLGITVRFNAYRTVYYNDAVDTNPELVPPSVELTKKLEIGGFQPNPARSMMVGVIGLWRRGEPVHEPGERIMITGSAFPPPPPPPAPFIGSVPFRFNGSSLVLDLSNSINEDGLDQTKHDFGDLTVVAMHPVTNNAVTLATLGYGEYDKDAYLRTSGIVTLPVDPAVAAVAANANLELRSASGRVFLAEAPLRAVPLTPNLYINDGDTQTQQFRVYDRGVPASEGIAVTTYVMSADSNTIQSSFVATTDASGMISFPITGTRGSITAYVPVPGPDPQPPSGGINTQVNTYAYVRTLPADDHLAQLDPTWDNVYKHVLANWNAMAPCMDNWLNLADESQVLAFTPLILKLTDPAGFENFRYMPVTRDLTPGMRALLYNFLNNPPTPAPKAKVMATAMDAALPAEEKVESFARLNRRMRGGE